jgi:hypothetical protein
LCWLPLLEEYGEAFQYDSSRIDIDSLKIQEETEEASTLFKILENLSTSNIKILTPMKTVFIFK